jgi:hypothetical protein
MTEKINEAQSKWKKITLENLIKCWIQSKSLNLNQTVSIIY